MKLLQKMTMMQDFWIYIFLFLKLIWKSDFESDSTDIFFYQFEDFKKT